MRWRLRLVESWTSREIDARAVCHRANTALDKNGEDDRTWLLILLRGHSATVKSTKPVSCSHFHYKQTWDPVIGPGPMSKLEESKRTARSKCVTSCSSNKLLTSRAIVEQVIDIVQRHRRGRVTKKPSNASTESWGCCHETRSPNAPRSRRKYTGHKSGWRGGLSTWIGSDGTVVDK